MGADYSFEVKNIEIWASAFFKHDNSFVATVLIYHLDFYTGQTFAWAGKQIYLYLTSVKHSEEAEQNQKKKRCR